MKEYKLNLTVFFSVIAIFSMTVIGILLMITHKYNWTELITLLWNYGFVTIPLSIIWLYFEKIGWRSNFWKWSFKIMHFSPDLRGRWEGTIDRVGENSPHKFVIEIKQTMTKLQFFKDTLNEFLKLKARNEKFDKVANEILDNEMTHDFPIYMSDNFCYPYESLVLKSLAQLWNNPEYVDPITYSAINQSIKYSKIIVGFTFLSTILEFGTVIYTLFVTFSCIIENNVR